MLYLGIIGQHAISYARDCPLKSYSAYHVFPSRHYKVFIDWLPPTSPWEYTDEEIAPHVVLKKS